MQLLNFNNLFLNEFSLDKKSMKKDLEKDYPVYLQLKEWFKGKQIEKNHLTFFHPGGGSDILSLLVVYDALVSSNNKSVDFIFMDLRDFYDGTIFNLKKYLKGAKVKHYHSKKRYHAEILFKDKTINIIYYVQDALHNFPDKLKNNIDVYYERAFEMFRGNDNIFMYRVFKNMRQAGLMMTDHSFHFGNIHKKFKKLENIPLKFGLYNNFQIWQRIKE